MDDIALVRLLIGDADSLLSDSQIQYFIDEHDDDPTAAAPYAANALYALMCVKASDMTTGSMSISWSQRAAQYAIFLASRGWDAIEGNALAGCYVAGVVQSEIDTDADDDTLAARKFTLGLHGDD